MATGKPGPAEVCNNSQLWYRPRFRDRGPHRRSAQPLSLSGTLEMLDCMHSIFNRFQNLGSTPQLPFCSWQAANMAGPITCQDGPQGPKTQIPAEGKAVCGRQSDVPINECTQTLMINDGTPAPASRTIGHRHPVNARGAEGPDRHAMAPAWDQLAQLCPRRSSTGV